MPAKTLKKEQSAPPPAYHDGDQERIPLNSYTEVQIQYQIDPLEIQVPVSSQCVEHKLCRKCRALSKTKFVRARLRDQLVDEPEELQYHDNISALWNAVAQHCHLCSLIWQKLIDDGSYRTGKIPGVDEKLTLQLHPATELNHQDTLEIICDAIPTAGEQKRQLALVTGEQSAS